MRFITSWAGLLWLAMQKTGHGYRRHTLKNQPPAGASRWRGERRPDKVGTTKLSRRLMQPLTGGAVWAPLPL